MTFPFSKYVKPSVRIGWGGGGRHTDNYMKEFVTPTNSFVHIEKVKGCTHRAIILCDGVVDTHRKQ